MELLSHLNPAHRQRLRVLDDDVPFQFIESFSRFYKNYYHQHIRLFYHPAFDAFIPIRMIESKFIRLGQVLHAPVCGSSELVPKDQLIFFNALIRYLKKNHLCYRLIQPHPYGILSALPPNVKWCDFGTYVTDLQSSSHEELLAAMNPKYQKAIAHSYKHQAHLKTSWDAFEDFYKVYAATMKRADMHGESMDYFLSLRNHLGDDHVVAAVVYDEQGPVGCAFFIYTRYAAFCTHAGSMGDTKLYGSMKFLHYEMMKYFKARKIKRYDLVGVRLKNNDPALEGIFRFKKGFGGELKAGYLWKTDIAPVKAFFYDKLLRIKTGKREQKDIIDQINN